MKSTIHSILHLHKYAALYGPFTTFNQFWVERKIGNIKHKPNATNLATESMTEQTKLGEAFKLLFNNHFQTEIIPGAAPSTNRKIVIGNNTIFLYVR